VTSPPPTTSIGSWRGVSVFCKGTRSRRSISGTTNLAVDAEFVHRVYNTQERVDAFCLLADHRLVDVKLNVVMVEVFLHLLSVDIVDVQVHDSQTSTPFFVAFCEVASSSVENVVDERKVVLDLLVALDVETVCRLGDSSFKVRHGNVQSVKQEPC